MSKDNVVDLFPNKEKSLEADIETPSNKKFSIIQKVRHALFDDLTFREVGKLMVKPTQDGDPKYALLLIPILYCLSSAFFNLFGGTPLYALYLGTALNIVVFYASFRFGLAERKSETEFRERVSGDIKQAYKKLLEIEQQTKAEELAKRNKWVSGLKSFDPLVDKLSRITSVAGNLININFRKK